jgi:hypothetical protein
MRIGANIVILATAELIALLCAEKFIDIPPPRQVVSSNLFLMSFLFFAFNITQTSSKNCDAQEGHLCPENVVQILLAATIRFSNIFSFSFLIRYIKIEFYFEQDRTQMWENLGVFAFFGASLPLLTEYYSDNLFNFMSI